MNLFKFFLLITVFLLSLCGAIAQTNDLIFIHHSCGQNWLDDGLRDALDAKSYIDEVNEITYGDTVTNDVGRPDSLTAPQGDNTNMDSWIFWFNDYLNNVKTQGCDDGSNVIIMFKSCYPISCISEDGTPPGDPFDFNQTLLNYQALYRHPSGPGNTYSHDIYTYKPLEDIFAENPNILFIAVTAPSNVPFETCNDWADRARVFDNWLKNNWQTSYNTSHPTLKNVVVFDWFDVLAYANAYAGTEIYTPANGDPEGTYPVRNMTKSDYRTGDSHPNVQANQDSTVIFATGPGNFIDAAYSNWKASSVVTWTLY